MRAIRQQEDQRRGLERRLETLSRPPIKFDRTLQHRIDETVGRWREVPGSRIPQARQIVSKLLVDRLIRPEGRAGQNGFTFEGTGTVEKLISGVLPGPLYMVWRPHRDSNPSLGLERAAS